MIKKRAAAIIIHDNSLLLMYREKDGHVYYAFPGGTVESGENPEDTVLREVYEETSLQVNLGKLLYRIHIMDAACCKDEYFYLCEYVSGIPQMHPDAVELQRVKEGNNYYELRWVSVSAIAELLVYPLEIRDWLLQDLCHGFQDNVRITKLLRSEMRQK